MSIPSRLISALRRYGQSLADPRAGHNTRYAMADFVLAGFAPFFMQSPSFLAHQRHLQTARGRSNCQTLFGMAKIPCDVRVRTMLDPIEPSHFYPMFADVIAELRQSGGLDAMRCLDGRLLIALDGTEYHCSQEIHCPNCSHRKRGKDKIEYFHSMLAATIVAPGHNHAVPLEPEFILPQDGHDKQDCESRAIRRWLKAHGARYQALKPVCLGDDLFSRQPICEAVLAEGGHFLFVCKPDSHPAIADFLSGITLETLTDQGAKRTDATPSAQPAPGEKRVDATQAARPAKRRRGGTRNTFRYRWLNDVPLRGDEKSITVNWFGVEICDAKGVVTYRNSFISDLPVHRDTVAAMVAAGRARWKVENEAFNTLKTKGYNLEHNFGHGQRHLASVLATLNLLAFATHTACDLADRAWRAARRQLVVRQGFFQTLLALTAYHVFQSWEHLLQTMAFARPPPQAPGGNGWSGDGGTCGRLNLELLGRRRGS